MDTEKPREASSTTFTWVALLGAGGELYAPAPTPALAAAAVRRGFREFVRQRLTPGQEACGAEVRGLVSREFVRLFDLKLFVTVHAASEREAFFSWCLLSRLLPRLALKRWRLGYPLRRGQRDTLASLVERMLKGSLERPRAANGGEA